MDKFQNICEINIYFIPQEILCFSLFGKKYDKERGRRNFVSGTLSAE